MLSSQKYALIRNAHLTSAHLACSTETLCSSDLLNYKKSALFFARLKKSAQPDLIAEMKKCLLIRIIRLAASVLEL